MNLPAILFLLTAAVALLALPRCWAPAPLLAGVCLMTLGQAVQIGPFTFTVVRIIIFVGLVRVLVRREWEGGKLVGLDKLLIAWAIWFAIASAFHEKPGDIFITFLGLIYNAAGTYFLIRCFCRTPEDLVGLIKILALVLAPVALAMLLEQLTHHNVFSALGGISPEPLIRNGRLRAQGPFLHPILAGTVGGGCLPLFVGLWRRHPRYALLGLAAGMLMIFASASSGPIMSAMVGLGGLALWRWRHLTRRFRILAVLIYLALGLVMSRPAYYILAYVDLTGSSTGYHRARIIQSAFEHLDDWWIAGTDYTRDWMVYGVSWSEDHADITNHYLGQGVKGGLPLMFLFIGLIWLGFRNVGQTLRASEGDSGDDVFLAWAVGAGLFAHAVTCISVAYFDQSVMFLYLNLAVTASLWSSTWRQLESAAVLGEGGVSPSLHIRGSYQGEIRNCRSALDAR